MSSEVKQRNKSKSEDLKISGAMSGDEQYTKNAEWSEKSDPNVKKTETNQSAMDQYNVRLFGWTFHRVILVTHVNIFLYSTCFWIQTGTLPVSIHVV